MKIPIQITVFPPDSAPFARRSEPVSIGVSLPRGEVQPTESWSLRDERDQSVPVQTTILDRWGDESIRWMLVDFQADAATGSSSHYLLVAGQPSEPREPLAVITSSGGLTIRTGTAMFTVPSSGPAAITEAQVSGRPVLNDLTVEAEDADGRNYRFDIERTSIVRSGPLAALVVQEGHLVASDSGSWLEATVALQFHAGLGTVRVEVSCTNMRAALHPEGIWDLGDPGSVLIRDLSVTMRPAPLEGSPAAITASVDRDQPLISRGDRFAIYQDSSGGDNWQSVNHVNRRGRVPTSFQGFRASGSDGEVVGLRATPLASLNSGERRITIATPYFWESFPKALTLTQELCAIGVLPKQFADVHELQGGERTTFAFFLAVGEDPVSAEPLAWARSPVAVSVDADVYRRAGLWAPLTVGSPTAQRRYTDLVEAVVVGDAPFSSRREAIDEYGWRNFGEIYADHEAVGNPGLISHYNNQYDAIAGMASRFMATGSHRWWTAMRELASHVTDIDLYHTAADRAAYNGGYFWHTQHYSHAGSATHRAYSRHSVTSGGGPSAEHNYTTGLLLHYFLTGWPQSRAAVIQLAEWVIDMDDGRKSRFWWIDRGFTGLASGTRSTDFHGPGRGAGNSINALLDAHRLTGAPRYLEKADALVARCVHPDDDQDELQLLDAENRWSYTVFLQTLGKYLERLADLGLIDQRYTYARDVLLNYARWMSRCERPYLEHPEQLEYPTETWAAQDIRKAAVFEFAARHSTEDAERKTFLERATYFFDYSVNTLRHAATGRLARPLVLLLAYGFQRPVSPDSPESDVRIEAALPRARAAFTPQRRRVVRRLLLTLAAGSLVALLVATLMLL